MQNSPTVVAAPPPRSAGQITVIPFPPPHPFDGAPSSIFQITVLPFPPPPPFADPPSSVDLSPLEFLLALLAVVTIPALIYTFIFAFGCPSRRRRRDAAAAGMPPPQSPPSRRRHPTVRSNLPLSTQASSTRKRCTRRRSAASVRYACRCSPTAKKSGS